MCIEQQQFLHLTCPKERQALETSNRSARVARVDLPGLSRSLLADDEAEVGAGDVEGALEPAVVQLSHVEIADVLWKNTQFLKQDKNLGTVFFFF